MYVAAGVPFCGCTHFKLLYKHHHSIGSECRGQFTQAPDEFGLLTGVKQVRCLEMNNLGQTAPEGREAVRKCSAAAATFRTLKDIAILAISPSACPTITTRGSIAELLFIYHKK